MSDWWLQPFTIEVEGKVWFVTTDTFSLVGVQTIDSAPHLIADSPIREKIRSMLGAHPTDTHTTSVQRLLKFLRGLDHALVVGVPVQAPRLKQVLSKLEMQDVSLWQTNQGFVGPCLGLSAPGWLAYVMGVEATSDWKLKLKEYDLEPDPYAAFPQ